jgi:hypothetical protein
MVKRLAFRFFSVTLMLFVSAESLHKLYYGHFIKPGLHTDIVLTNSDIGTNDTYMAHVWNFSAKTIEVEGCRLPGGYAGSGVLYHWDIQRWDPMRNDWSSLDGANNWLPKPFGHQDDNWSKCGGEMTQIRPLGSHNLAWVFKDWVTPQDSIRMAIHTSVKMPLDHQPIIYTQMFSIQK